LIANLQSEAANWQSTKIFATAGGSEESRKEENEVVIEMQHRLLVS